MQHIDSPSHLLVVRLAWGGVEAFRHWCWWWCTCFNCLRFRQCPNRHPFYRNCTSHVLFTLRLLLWCGLHTVHNAQRTTLSTQMRWRGENEKNKLWDRFAVCDLGAHGNETMPDQGDHQHWHILLYANCECIFANIRWHMRCDAFRKCIIPYIRSHIKRSIVCEWRIDVIGGWDVAVPLSVKVFWIASSVARPQTANRERMRVYLGFCIFVMFYCCFCNRRGVWWEQCCSRQTLGWWFKLIELHAFHMVLCIYYMQAYGPREHVRKGMGQCLVGDWMMIPTSASVHSNT